MAGGIESSGERASGVGVAFTGLAGLVASATGSRGSGDERTGSCAVTPPESASRAIRTDPAQAARAIFGMIGMYSPPAGTAFPASGCSTAARDPSICRGNEFQQQSEFSRRARTSSLKYRSPMRSVLYHQCNCGSDRAKAATVELETYVKSALRNGASIPGECQNHSWQGDSAD